MVTVVKDNTHLYNFKAYKMLATIIRYCVPVGTSTVKEVTFAHSYT